MQNRSASLSGLSRRPASDCRSFVCHQPSRNGKRVIPLNPKQPGASSTSGWGTPNRHPNVFVPWWSLLRSTLVIQQDDWDAIAFSESSTACRIRSMSAAV